jgi:hypothetical protein
LREKEVDMRTEDTSARLATVGTDHSLRMMRAIVSASVQTRSREMPFNSQYLVLVGFIAVAGEKPKGRLAKCLNSKPLNVTGGA